MEFCRRCCFPLCTYSIAHFFCPPFFHRRNMHTSAFGNPVPEKNRKLSSRLVCLAHQSKSDRRHPHRAECHCHPDHYPRHLSGYLFHSIGCLSSFFFSFFMDLRCIKVRSFFFELFSIFVVFFCEIRCDFSKTGKHSRCIFLTSSHG